MADEYVPIGGWEAAGYSGFSPAPSALSTVNQAQFNTLAPTPNYDTRQQLVSPDSSYAQVRGWNPDPLAMNNTGPALVGGDWGGLMSRNALYPTTGGRTPSPVPQQDTRSPYGDLSGVGFSTNPGGDYNDVFNAPPVNPFGDLSGVPQASIDTSFQNPAQPYAMPATGSPYGDLVRPQPVASSPYGDLSGSQPSPLSTAYTAPTRSYQTPTTASTFGSLSGVSIPRRSPYGDLSGSQPSPIDTSFRAPSTGVRMPGGFGDLSNATSQFPSRTGGAGLFAAAQPIDTSPKNPATTYRTPTTATTFGSIGEPMADAMSLRDFNSIYNRDNELVMPQGPGGIYGNLLGADDGGDTSYQTASGAPLAPPAPAIDTSPRNPAMAYAGPGMSPQARTASQFFGQGVTPTPRPAPVTTPSTFGALNRTFTPMPGQSETKFNNRVPQSGGFVSYSGPEPTVPSLPQRFDGTGPSTGVQAISRALGGGNIFSRNIFGNR